VELYSSNINNHFSGIWCTRSKQKGWSHQQEKNTQSQHVVKLVLIRASHFGVLTIW
jgi:hypothetical protein